VKGGPSVIEAKAYRWHGHFEGDPALYRAEGEVQRLREKHDPLKIFTSRVKQHITQEELTAIDEEVEALVNDAVLKARAAAYPAPEDLLTDVYVSY
jgi:pyruvate dehydrogenase E1 component alpha subunit